MSLMPVLRPLRINETFNADNATVSQHLLRDTVHRLADLAQCSYRWPDAARFACPTYTSGLFTGGVLTLQSVNNSQNIAPADFDSSSFCRSRGAVQDCENWFWLPSVGGSISAEKGFPSISHVNAHGLKFVNNSYSLAARHFNLGLFWRSRGAVSGWKIVFDLTWVGGSIPAERVFPSLSHLISHGRINRKVLHLATSIRAHLKGLAEQNKTVKSDFVYSRSEVRYRRGEDFSFLKSCKCTRATNSQSIEPRGFN